jgi:hypothetical protein
MKLKIISLIFSLTALLNFSCNTTEPPVNNHTINLTVEDVSCTEAWIKVSSNSCDEIIITKDDTPVAQISNLCSKDTLIVIDSLFPNQSYTFQAVVSHGGNITSGSEKVTATTMDTTSHNFTFEKFEFGEHSSSALYDVAIIDENNIWAVGEIYLKDSSGNDDPLPYNAVHWNGIKWEVKRISIEFRGNLITLPLEGIFALSAIDIWLIGSLPIHGDGENWEIYDIRATVDASLSLSKAWGTSSNDMYFVGRGGSLAHYNGQSWKKINSGKDLDIYDIWGDRIPGSEDYEIVCAASNVLQNDGKEVIRIKNNLTEKLTNEGLSPYFSGIWFKPTRKYYIVGGGIHKKNNVTTSEPWYRYTPGTINNYYSNSISGTNLNDIFVCGAFGEIVHFNGISWSNFTSTTYMPDGVYISLSIKENLVVLTGYKGTKAIITIGRR